jgi:hypothetical protein
LSSIRIYCREKARLYFLQVTLLTLFARRKIAKLFKRKQIKGLLLEKEVFFISSQEKINKEKKRNANDK